MVVSISEKLKKTIPHQHMAKKKSTRGTTSKKSNKSKIALWVIVLGVIMFLTGAGIFAYQGTPLHPVISQIGTWSFILWLPTVLLGLILRFIYRKS